MKLYIAAPYSNKDASIVEHRVEQINKITAIIMQHGHIVFSPISMCHSIALLNNLPTSAEYWEKQNNAFLLWCEAVIIINLPNFQESKGINKEVIFAKKNNKKIHLYNHINNSYILNYDFIYNDN